MARRLRANASNIEASLSDDAEGTDRLQRLVDAAPTPVELVIWRELMVRVSVELGALAEQDRDLFVAHYRHGRSIRELAEAGGVTAQVIRQRLCRTRKRLKNRLLEAGWDED